MSGKKNNDSQFNNPFSALKGLSVSDRPEPKKKTEPAPKESPRPVDEEPDRDVDFFAEMAGLGVRKIEADCLEKSFPARAATERPETRNAQSSETLEGGSGVARARRDKRLRRGDIKPQAELDLHGLKADVVRQRVAWFLENAVFHGFEAVRIITGKGSRSEQGPVLRPLVEDYLDGPGREFAVEWLRATRQHGGEGAIIVFLRQT